MNGFEKRKQQKMSQILHAAIQLFCTQGIQQTAVSDIAKAANVSQVTIYNYFETKQQLIEQTILSFIDHEYQQFNHLVHNEKFSFAQKIEAMILNKTTLARTIHPEFYDLVMQEYAKPDSLIHQSFLTKGMALFQTFFEQGKREGIVHPDLSHETLFFYMEMMSSYMQKEEVYKHILPHTKQLMNLFFYGLAGKREDT